MSDARRVAALVFDAYGTLFDVSSVGAACARFTSDPDGLVSLWRAKQLEYSFLRSLIGPAAYVDFWTITGDALDFAAQKLGLALSAADRVRALNGWLEVRPYPEVESALDVMAGNGRRCAILSNGNPAMLDAALRNSGLASRFEAVLSADAVGVFKPDPRVYQLAVDRLSIPREEVLFVSSNGWDAAGARAFGLAVAWINRTGSPVERLGVAPDLVVADLALLKTILEAEPLR